MVAPAKIVVQVFPESNNARAYVEAHNLPGSDHEIVRDWRPSTNEAAGFVVGIVTSQTEGTVTLPISTFCELVDGNSSIAFVKGFTAGRARRESILAAHRLVNSFLSPDIWGHRSFSKRSRDP